jgi:hypothetical protein
VDDYLAAGHTLQDLASLIQMPRLQAHPAPAAIELLECAPASYAATARPDPGPNVCCHLGVCTRHYL